MIKHDHKNKYLVTGDWSQSMLTDTPFSTFPLIWKCPFDHLVMYRKHARKKVSEGLDQPELETWY